MSKRLLFCCVWGRKWTIFHWLSNCHIRPCSVQWINILPFFFFLCTNSIVYSICIYYILCIYVVYIIYAWIKLQGKTIDTCHNMTETGHQILVDESVIFYFCIKEKYELMPVSFSFFLFSSRVIEILVDERISNNKGLWEVPNSVKWQKKGIKVTTWKFLNLTI